jgi:hypothetical protein
MNGLAVSTSGSFYPFLFSFLWSQHLLLLLLLLLQFPSVIREQTLSKSGDELPCSLIMTKDIGEGTERVVGHVLISKINVVVNHLEGGSLHHDFALIESGEHGIL